MADRLYFNGGVAMSQTTSVAGGAMGRLGFSIGFGGPPSSQKQQQLSEIPGINRGSSLMEFGNGTNSSGDINLINPTPPPDQKAGDLIFAKTSSPTILNPALIAASNSNNSDVERLRQRLSELEREIVKLRSGESNSSANDKIKILTELLNEKDARQNELSVLVSQMKKQMNDQQKTIEMLLKRFSKS